VPFLNNGGSPVKTAMRLLIILLTGVAHAQLDDVTLTGNAQSVPGMETLAKSPFQGLPRDRMAVCVGSGGRRSASGGILSVAGVR